MTRKKTDFFGIHRSNADVVSCFEPVSEFHAHRTRDLGSIRFPMIAARWLFFVPGTPRARCRPHTALHRGGREGRPRRFARVRVDRVAPTMPTATPARRGASLARALPSPGQPSETPRRHPTASDGPSLGVVGSALSPTSRARRARSSASPHLADPEGRHVRRSPRPLPLAPTDERDDDQADVGYPSEALGIRGYAARRTLATRASPARPAPEDVDTLEEQPPASVVRVAARADVYPRDDKPESPTSVEPALGLLNASSNANAAARVRTDDGSVGTLGTLSTLSTRGSHPSSPDAAACRARRIEDDFERMRERYRDRLATVEAAIVAARAEGDAFEAAGRFGNARERETFPDRSRAFEASDADAAADSDSDAAADADSNSDPTRAWSPEDSEGDAVLEAAYAEAFGAAAAHAAAAAASARAAERAMAASRARTPPTIPGDGLGPDPASGSGSGLGDVDDALRELEARMEANDRGAGGDAEEYDEFAAARIEREYLLDTSDDEDDPFATGEFGAGDRGAGDRLDDDDGHHLTDASLARVRERARAERAADLVARSRAREAERDESERFLRRLARIGVPPCSTRRLSLFPDHERRRPAGANLVDALGFQLDADLERAWASRRAGEDPGESLFARFAREDAAVAAGGWRKHAGDGGGDGSGAARDIFGRAARAPNESDAREEDVLGESLGSGRTRAVSCVAFARARATTDARDAARDSAFIASVLAGLPGVDPGDDRVVCAVAAVAR